jgi:hypothetical protein
VGIQNPWIPVRSLSAFSRVPLPDVTDVVAIDSAWDTYIEHLIAHKSVNTYQLSFFPPYLSTLHKPTFTVITGLNATSLGLVMS